MLLLLDNKFYYCFTRYTLVYCALSLFYFNILDFYLRRLCCLNGSIIINCVIYSIPCVSFSFISYHFGHDGHLSLHYTVWIIIECELAGVITLIGLHPRGMSVSFYVIKDIPPSISRQKLAISN